METNNLKNAKVNVRNVLRRNYECIKGASIALALIYFHRPSRAIKMNLLQR